MIEKKIMIINKLGLHARASAKLVTLSNSFQSKIKLKHKQKKANGKSIMSVMMLAAAQGTELTLYIKGNDEEQACLALETLINQRFNEAE